jgi:hypothetical protein
MISRPDIESAIQRVKQQIFELESVQKTVYHDAIYIDMTPEIVKECDARRRRIMELIEELIALRELAA